MGRAPARLVVALLAGGLALAAPAAAGLADRVGATFVLMAADFVKAAHPLEGLVVSVDGDLIYTDLGEAAGAQAGQELTVFRTGEPFHHLFTGKMLGHYEDVLGWVQIRRVDKEFSEGVFIPLRDRPRPQVADGVRISRGRIRIAITPVLDLTNGTADVRRVPYLIASVLERSKRFQVVDPLAVSDMFANGTVSIEQVLARPERAIRVARNLEVSGWLVPVLLERRGVIYLDTTWISAVTGMALLSRRLPLLSGGVAEEQRFPWEPRPED
ncbi:MAG: hypothetical protein AUH29_15435 [Candidatus Rokubacteria bacterium 13_1_40CM_69_27]|nr:MAG: hypothetical protein AUH29_15435 [Candidatus Rokubacteria bacterium 13_1_40CM_69_27]